MNDMTRESILKRLREAPRTPSPARPALPELSAAGLDYEGRIERFTAELTAQTGVVHRVPNDRIALDTLTDIAREEGLKHILTATDAVLHPLDLATWGKKSGVELRTAADYADREAFKEAAFTWADAGLTGAPFGVAETGTLGVIHDADSPRLISIAPILHIAVLRAEDLAGVYEQVTGMVFGGRIPSQFSFITGPSMTADIQATQFKGMHGPRRLMVVLIG